MANLVMDILHFKMYKNSFESFEDNCVNKCVDTLLSDSAVLCACLNKLEVWRPTLLPCEPESNLKSEGDNGHPQLFESDKEN